MRFLGRQSVVEQMGKKKDWQRALYSRMLDKLEHNERGTMVWR